MLGAYRGAAGVCRGASLGQKACKTAAMTAGASGSGRARCAHVTAASGGAAAGGPPAPRPLPDLTSVRGMLFDIDGTLTNSDPLHFLAFQEILVEVGFDGGRPISEDFFRSRISGHHNPEIAADLFPEWSVEQHVAFYTDKEQRFRDLAGSKLQRMPGLTEWIAWLRGRGVRMAAVTNAPRANTELMLAALGLDAEFEHVVLGEDCPRAKPHPDPYLRAMELIGVAPHEALVVEDSPAGLRAAVAAGVPAVGITTGQPRDVLVAAGACLLVDDFTGLLGVALQHASGDESDAAAAPPPPAVAGAVEVRS
ncbi:MAG: HAD-like domain-containing protein [Monoraphidium minutum]|nr:MAG: HAD-like domain-containing protein [Monoraphidium minutum]